MFELIPEALRLPPLAGAVLSRQLPGQWLAPSFPQSGADLRAEAEGAGARSFRTDFSAIKDAFGGDGTPARLLRVVSQGGVLVTTGQQPGLFGGPLFTWYKAFSALALADAIESRTGLPVAPVFWAATDDSDIAEASWTAVAVRGGAQLLRSVGEDMPDGVPMYRYPLGDLSSAFAELERSIGPAASHDLLHLLKEAYTGGRTAGDAYVAFLRAVLVPRGIAVLDASHPRLRAAADPILRQALEQAPAIDIAVRDRNQALLKRGYQPQVHEVPGLSLVFAEEHGVRRRIPLADSFRAAQEQGIGALSPNVLLRPVLERTLLPTVAYVGGPGEISYFAQSSAVAEVLACTPPRIVPRLSAIMLEEHISRILDRWGLERGDLADPHAALNRLARESLPDNVTNALALLRSGIDDGIAALGDALADDASGMPAYRKILDGARGSLEYRLARLERRIIARTKQRESRIAEDVLTARAALYPFGRRQERTLGITPFLARHGELLLDEIGRQAAVHAESLLSGTLGALPERSGVD